jgi:hypothetical protein
LVAAEARPVARKAHDAIAMNRMIQSFASDEGQAGT